MGKKKSGKSLNPADAQRKLDRKRDIKRCKKQRGEVRKAVLKNKDTDTLFDQMAKIDDMAFDANNAAPLPVLVMDAKRQRLRETIIRVLSMHKKEEEWTEFNKVRAQLRDYDLQKKSMEDSYEAVKFAKEADPLSIPMPDGLATAGAAFTPILDPQIAQHVPKHLLLPDAQPSSGILKRHHAPVDRKPPGPPVGLPPSLSDSEGEEEDYEDNFRQPRGVRFADEGEEGDYRQTAQQQRRAGGSRDDASMSSDRFARPPPPPPGMPPIGNQMPFRPPMDAPHHQPMSMNANRQPLGPAYRPQMPAGDSAVISAAPALHRAIGPSTTADSAPAIAQQPSNSQMFQSKAVMRNMRAEVTKLIPTAVRVKRAPPANAARPGLTMRMTKGGAASRGFAPPSSLGRPAPPSKPMTDDAYSQFMKEMKDLL